MPISLNVSEEDTMDLQENEVIITSNGDKMLQTFETSKYLQEFRRFRWNITAVGALTICRIEFWMEYKRAALFGFGYLLSRICIQINPTKNLLAVVVFYVMNAESIILFGGSIIEKLYAKNINV